MVAGFSFFSAAGFGALSFFASFTVPDGPSVVLVRLFKYKYNSIVINDDSDRL